MPTEKKNKNEKKNECFSITSNKYTKFCRKFSRSSVLHEQHNSYVYFRIEQPIQVESRNLVWIFTLLLAFMHTHKHTHIHILRHTNTTTHNSHPWKTKEIIAKSQIFHTSALLYEFSLNTNYCQRCYVWRLPRICMFILYDNISISSTTTTSHQRPEKSYEKRKRKKNRPNIRSTNQMSTMRDDTLAIK